MYPMCHMQNWISGVIELHVELIIVLGVTSDFIVTRQNSHNQILFIPMQLLTKSVVLRWQSLFDLRGRLWRDCGVRIESALQIEYALLRLKSRHSLECHSRLSRKTYVPCRISFSMSQQIQWNEFIIMRKDISSENEWTFRLQLLSVVY